MTHSPVGELHAGMIKRDPDARKVRAYWTKILTPTGEITWAFAIISAEDYERLGHGDRGEPRLAAL